jgi:CARDB
MLSGFKTARTEKSQSNSFPIEQLESRTYYDLVPLVAVVPTSLTATVKTKDTITVDLTNTGATTIKGPYTLELFASPDGSLSDATPIITLNNNLAPLPAGKTRIVRVPLGAFPSVPTNNYTILAQVTGALTSNTDNLAASSTQVSVAAPFIDLSDAFTYTGPAAVKPGQSIVDIITVTNNGNVPAKGPLEIDLSQSTNSDGSDAIQFTTQTVSLNVAPGKTQSFHFPFTIPVTIPPGTYYGVATIDPSNTFNDTDTTNNTTVSQGGLPVLSLYANLVGTLTGPYDFNTGQDKGTTGTLTIVVTDEDNTTGELTGTGTTTNGADFSFTGTLTPQGAVNLTTDVPGGCTVIGHFANGTFKGIIDLTAKDSSGEFSISLPAGDTGRPLKRT